MEIYFFSLENNSRSTFPFKSLIIDLSLLSLNTATSDKTSLSHYPLQ